MIELQNFLLQKMGRNLLLDKTEQYRDALRQILWMRPIGDVDEIDDSFDTKAAVKAMEGIALGVLDYYNEL